MALGLAGSGTTPPLYPVGSTSTDYVAAGFIPEIWSGKLIEKFYAATVLAAISNTDYEGEIKSYGDRVKIRTKPTLIINNYLVNGDLALQRPAGSSVELTIDQGKYFAAIIDDVIEKQSDINNMSLWSDDASEQMKIVVDSDVLLFLMGQASPFNRGLTAGAISGNINLGVTGTPVATVGRNPSTGQVEIIDVLLRLGQALDEQNIPETGRWVVMPTWATFQIKRSELREVFVSGDSVSILRNGKFGQIDRFTIYASNLLPNGVSAGLAAGEWPVFAGHAHGLTFASQLTNVETIRSERTFGQILRGLQVYGRQVLDNKAIAQAIVTQVAGT
jgi:hypothetical protein